MKTSEIIYSAGIPQLGPEALVVGGNAYFVDATNGLDSNSGESIDKPVKTLSVAYAKCVDGHNDVVYVLGGSSALSQTAAFTWAKSYTHLVGLAAPTRVSMRARITQASTATTVVNLFTVSGAGCIIKGIQFFQGVASATPKVACVVTGSRDVFINCHFAGVGHATMDAAGAASLCLDGAVEPRFVGCTIGIDTQGTRTSNSTELLIKNTSAQTERPVFEKCLFNCFISNANHPMIKINAADSLLGYVLFEDCTFISESTNNGTAMSSLASIPAAMQTAYIVYKKPTIVGITTIDANSRGKSYSDAVAPAASAAGGLATTL